MKNLKRILAAAAAIGIIAVTAGCGCSNAKAPAKSTPKPTATPAPTMAANVSDLVSSGVLDDIIKADIKLKDGREIKVDLYPNLAPITVANFVKLSKEGFYDGLVFHRIIDDFMIQGGGFDENLQQKEAEAIKGEFGSNGVTNNLPHMVGVISMARLGNNKDSASSQFFIMDKYQPSLDGDYAAFGRVNDEESLQVVHDLADVETHNVDQVMQDVPVELPVIETITIEE